MTIHDRNVQPHPSHRMGPEHQDIRCPGSTPRFYGVRECTNCEAEVISHPAGHFMDEELASPCQEEERDGAP